METRFVSVLIKMAANEEEFVLDFVKRFPQFLFTVFRNRNSCLVE